MEIPSFRNAASLLFLTLNMIIILPAAASATVYYVDATAGINSNNGCCDSSAGYTDCQSCSGTNGPWQTISKVNGQSFNPGDYILFKRGETWREQLNVPSSGNSTNPIVFGVYGTGANPIISGSDIVATGWDKNSTNIWTAAVVTQPMIVYFNEVRGTPVGSIAAITSEFYWNWSSNVLYVWSPTDSDPGAYYTSPGIEAGARAYGVIRTNDKSYVTVDGLTIRDGNGQGINVGSVSVRGIVFQNCVVERNSVCGFELKGSTIAHDVTIDHCTIQNNGEWGIAVSNQYTSGTISNNVITGNGFNSVANKQEYSQIDGILGNFNIFGNTIYATTPAGCKQGNSLGHYCHGIYYSAGFGGDRTIPANIYRNTVYNNSYGAGIKAVGSANIYRNRVYGNNDEGISLGQNDVVNAVYQVYSNLVYGNNVGNAGNGIVEQNKGAGTIDLTIENNVVYQNGNTNGHEIKITDNLDALTIKNNILWATPTRRTLGIITTQTGTVNIDYNLHWRADGDPAIRFVDTYPTWMQWQALGFDVHGKNADPLFADAANRNFTLLLTSPAIDNGTDVGLSQDYAGSAIPQGSAPDMGAYEYDSGTSCIHKSDNSPCDGCISMSELTTFIDRWKINNLDVTMKEIIEAIGLWKMGGC